MSLRSLSRLDISIFCVIGILQGSRCTSPAGLMPDCSQDLLSFQSCIKRPAASSDLDWRTCWITPEQPGASFTKGRCSPEGILHKLHVHNFSVSNSNENAERVT